MKAIVRTEYGTPEVLQLSEIEEPAPTDIEVRVQIHASSINYGDWGLLTGRPFFLRLTEGGLREPRIEILGGDVAGRVEAVGRNTKQFQPGDEVDLFRPGATAGSGVLMDAAGSVCWSRSLGSSGAQSVPYINRPRLLCLVAIRPSSCVD